MSSFGFTDFSFPIGQVTHSVAFALGSLALLVLALGLLAGWLVFFWSFLRFGMFNVLVLAKVRSA
ncbi:hypothetical protein Bca4012_032020 [Brassica carinata]